MSFPVVDSAYAGSAGVALTIPGVAVGAPVSVAAASVVAAPVAAAAAQQSDLSRAFSPPNPEPSVITALSFGLGRDVAGSALYTADGLLQANAADSGGGSVLQQAVDKELVAALSAKAVGAGVYNGMGVLESLPYSRVTDLGSLLRFNPQLSYIQVGNSYNQGTLESLDIIA